VHLFTVIELVNIHCEYELFLEYDAGIVSGFV